MSPIQRSPNTQKKDLTDVNRMKVLNLLHKEWHARFGKPDESEFDYLADMAWEIAHKVPSDLLLKDADELTLADIMESEEVQNAELTRQYESDYPDAYEDDEVGKSNTKVIAICLAGIALFLILASIASSI